MAAAVLLLAAAVLLHMGTPHHASSAPHMVSATTPAIESETDEPHGPASASASAQVGTNSAHLDTTADSPVLAPRTDQPAVEPAPADDARADMVAGAEAEALPRAAHPRTAREVWSPASALPPDAATLQTFRC
ncbi:hypothetical protein SAZ11_02020 [Streptomyces sp. FXJ1.4098]|nr:hypothetical protein [Streptomyces sp. FXJ1.4098]